jgi:hypothetical protein
MKVALPEMWRELPSVEDILTTYYNEWFEIKRDIKTWKKKQDRRETHEDM